MQSRTCFPGLAGRARSPFFALCATAGVLSALSVGTAHAQVYSSLAGTLTTPTATANFAAVDDYTTNLPLLPDDVFQVTSISFVGGPIFDGAPDPTGANNTLNFAFLDQFGGPVSAFSVAFDTSGSMLRTISVNATATAKGFFQVSSSATTVATFALTDAAPTVGLNDPSVGNPNPPAGVRAFAINGGPFVAPEPGSAALLMLGVGGMAGLGAVRTRRRRN